MRALWAAPLFLLWIVFNLHYYHTQKSPLFAAWCGILGLYIGLLSGVICNHYGWLLTY